MDKLQMTIIKMTICKNNTNKKKPTSNNNTSKNKWCKASRYASTNSTTRQ